MQALGFSSDEDEAGPGEHGDVSTVKDTTHAAAAAGGMLLDQAPKARRHGSPAISRSSSRRSVVRLDSAWLVNQVLLPLLRVAMRYAPCMHACSASPRPISPHAAHISPQARSDCCTLHRMLAAQGAATLLLPKPGAGRGCCRMAVLEGAAACS